MVDTKAMEVVVEEGDRLVSGLHLLEKAIEFAQRWGERKRNYIALDSEITQDIAALPRRSFSSTNREPITFRQPRRRRFYPRIFVSRI
ncbi:hypothetical protein [Bradyrhizobium sp. RDI18]|uniref:hypothetical protein n=1 Tax=Bradyrhizobium sp. RDI18 TaxID=3367400 RepID=UPI00371C8F66